MFLEDIPFSLFPQASSHPYMQVRRMISLAHSILWLLGDIISCPRER